ncbi:Glycosyl transferases group 1 [Eubacterium aggregans]|uniref:Glycosyl transferases group 1 n=1 Tax=Eubacterium aggregans TaxID=81409 RepID=A0A1H3Y8P5_9FIRM|nr:glycosyltransferase [Eubacterium aggregans]SEA08047.1 Glycosyl transferases group 1 [Eubacterium aggregans]
MAKYKIGIVGYFAKGKSRAGGQEAKTCSIDRALKEKYGKKNVLNIDTTDWKDKPFQLLWGLIRLAIQCDNIIMLPAQNSIRIFIPILQDLNFLLQHKLFYSVVGGWLPEYLTKEKKLANRAKKLNCIFVETKSMKKSLNEMGFSNIDIVPNFKYLTPVDEKDLNQAAYPPYNICTFSRVMKEKGIEDIICAVTNINSRYKKVVFQLDIYGKIDDGYLLDFRKIQESFPEFISYKGMVEPEESVTVLKNYFALAFPTRYYTEGIPGTLVDAYMSGVPVISALWGNSEDVFIDNITGWGYKFEDIGDLERVLEKIIENPENFVKMKKSSLECAKKYLPEDAIKIICSYFEK